jgi:hypothetical protein
VVGGSAVCLRVGGGNQWALVSFGSQQILFQNLGFSESFGEVVFALDTAGYAWNFEQFHSPREIEPVADCIFFLFSNSAGWIGVAISNAELSKLTAQI